jgi:DNA-binding NtrC family response regulator
VLDGRSSEGFRLVCFEGPNKGAVFSIPAATAARVLVGQSSACTVRLVDPLVSRRHLAVQVQGPCLHVHDLGSRNGTYANDVSVVEALLWGGETLRLGGTALRVELDESTTPTELSNATRFGRIHGASIEMRRLYPFFEQLAASSLPLLIEGETGTGKELLAECLHEQGPRANGPLHVLDGSNLPTGDVDGLLFGDEATGRPGIFELADRGTLLLDEVGEIPADVQRKLLRVLERSEVQRVGSNAARRIDVRVIATTRLDLDKLVHDGAFREDLYYRLVVSRVELPPLRKRAKDILHLARHFWSELGGATALDESTLVHLSRQPWPGNVRELRNRIARLVTFGEAEPTLFEPSPATSAPASAPGGLIESVLRQDLPLARARELVVSEFERAYVARVLAEHGGHVGKAAAASGLARRYFQLLRAKRLPRP